MPSFLENLSLIQSEFFSYDQFENKIQWDNPEHSTIILPEELQETMRELRDWNVDILTIGQYLQPSRKHLPIARYYSMEEFQQLKDYGYSLGESAPLVRSSYHAAEQVRALSPYQDKK